MTYLWLSLVFMLPAVLAAVLLRRRIHWAAASLSALVLLVLTAIFDNVMIGLDFFHYAQEHLMGLHVGLAPWEDFSYPLAGVLLLSSLWHLLRGRAECAGKAERVGQTQRAGQAGDSGRTET